MAHLAIRRLGPLAALTLLHCIQAQPGGPEGRLAIDVAPLNLSGITNADYVLTVHNGPNGTGDVVWTRAMSSQQYGDGSGSLSYVGTCDASTGTNTVTLELTNLYDVSGTVPVGTYMNPTPVTRQITCVENADVAVQFDVTLARQADQGFFDVAVQFKDMFCSAKLDCQNADGTDLDLLHNASGARDMTVVLGFACTGSLTGTTYLYMDDLVVDCTGQALDVHVAPVGLGNVTPTANPGGYLFGAAVYRGVEGFAGKAYWNVSLGLDASKFAALGTCTLTTRATASDTPFPQEALGFPLPPGTIYPVIDWDVVLSDASGRVCTGYQVNDGPEVMTHYLGYLPLLGGFTWSDTAVYMMHRFQPVHPSSPNGQVLSAGTPICNPGCDHGVCALQGETPVCNCDGTGYSGATCATPVCTVACVHGICSAPETCDCTLTGYTGAQCELDVDECATSNGGCEQQCVNVDGSFSCACDAGYTLNADGVHCDDVDECATNNGGCGDPGAWTCTNTVGGFTCTDRDECALGTDTCAVGAVCTNTSGGFTCDCGAGGVDVLGDGSDCAYETSCATLHDAQPALGSGPYIVDPDGDGGADPFTAYCDMTTDGGGWTFVATVTNQGDGVDQGSWLVTTPTPNAWESTTATFGVPDPTLNADYRGAGFHALTADAVMITHKNAFLLRTDNACLGGASLQSRFAALAWTCGGSAVLSGATGCANACAIAASTPRAGDTALLGGTTRSYLYFKTGEADGAQDNNKDRAYLSTDYRTNVDEPVGLGAFCSGINCTPRTGEADVNDKADAILPTAPTEFYGLWVREITTRQSCLDVLDAGLSTGDGLYWIDPDGPGGDPAIEVYCDMTTDGGGWTFLANITNQGDGVNQGNWLQTVPAPNAWESTTATFGTPDPALNADYRSAAFHRVPGDALMVTHRNAFLLRTDAACLGGQTLRDHFAGLGWTCTGSAALSAATACAHACTIAASTPRAGDTAILNGSARTALYFKAGEADGVQDTNKDRSYLSTNYRANVDTPVGLGAFCSGTSCSPRTGEADVNDLADAIVPTAATEFYGLWAR
ncbi:MAG: hypothetical protein EP329_23490 [Deltaproteobacteria bacterium]|nr:MAG: hypothetical protein EP329_23490 [Deltaproteobacteria bacterium]